MIEPETAPPTPSETRSNSRKALALSLGTLLAAAALLFFAGLGRFPLLEPDEGRNAEVGREMVALGDWITPHYNSFAYLDKPVLHFWLVAASMKTFGVSEAAARLPSALMALATMLLVWFLARRMFGNAAGVRAGLVFAACPLTIVLAREVIFDMTLTFLVTAAMVAFWLAEEKGFRAPWCDVLMFAAMGLAVITKGFVGIIIPLIAVLIYQAVRGRWREWLRLRWGWGLLVLLAVALPWFIAVSVRNPDFPRYAFWDESLKRFSTGASHRGGGIFYYIPVFLGGFFPWSLFLLPAGWNRLRRWRELRQEACRPILFLLIWSVWVGFFFSLSHSKLPAYFLPAIPPLSILVGLAWREVGRELTARLPDWLTAGFALLLGAGVLVAAASQSWLYSAFLMRSVRKLPPHLASLVQPSLLYTGLILAALGFLGRRLATKAHGPGAATATFAIAAVVVPILAIRWYRPLQYYAEANSSRRLGATILSSPERDAPIFGYYYFRTSLPFYLRRPVGLVSVEWGEMTSNFQVAQQRRARQAGAPDPGRGLLITARELRDFSKRSAGPVLVMTPDRLVESLWSDVGHINPLWDQSEYSVWEVPPGSFTRPGNEPSAPPARVVPPFQP